MAKFRKKPVVIEAIQWNGGNSDEIYAFIGEEPFGDFVHDVTIKTLEGVMTASIGDWIIKGVSGEFYPCKPDIFQKTYEGAWDGQPQIPPSVLVSEVTEAIRSAYTERLVNHIKYVQLAGRRIGVPHRLLDIHDNSKWLPDEFDAYALYFCSGVDKSPADADFVSDKFAKAWLHHIHHNPHHWQHWIFPDGFSPKGSSVENGVVEMPQIYALEMIADWMGASRVYTGSWDMTDWLGKNMGKIRLHHKTAEFVRKVLDMEGYADTVYLYRFAGEV